MKKKYLIPLLFTFFVLILLGASQIRRDNRVITQYSFSIGRKTVTTAGTAIVVDVECESLLIKALADNSGYIYVGGSTVSSSNGFELAAGDAITIDNYMGPTTIYIDSSENGDGICYAILN